MKLFTIGFTKTSAEAFFNRIKDAGVKRVIDVRLHNVSQLAGFAKRDDLKFFLHSICGIGYEHKVELAPTEEMLKGYRADKASWPAYEKKFLKLIRSRQIEKLPKSIFTDSCLLCSEDKPHFCHRRLVAEYLKEHWKDVEIEHL